MKRPILSLSQQRGQWYATAQNSRTREIVGSERIAVVRDWENGMMNWKSSPPHYEEREEHGWWGHAAAGTWKELLLDDAAVWIRKARKDGTENASVGRSAGIWRIGNVVKADDVLSFDLVDRIAEVK